jgi:hypothetical protein
VINILNKFNFPSKNFCKCHNAPPASTTKNSTKLN